MLRCAVPGQRPARVTDRKVVQVSQEISSPGKIVAEAKFPRIFGRPNLTERPYFLGNIAAPRKFCRSRVRGSAYTALQ